jgi:2,3-bisphosphoglycerate-independent phosphoglycerate mutase
MKSRPNPLVMLIIDGYGISFIKEGNAIMAAKQPNMDRLMREYPMAIVQVGRARCGLTMGRNGKL